jgi:hypothetical protein
MFGHILISLLLIGGLAGVFALSLWFAGRSDRIPGCAGEGCAHCQLNSGNECADGTARSARKEHRPQEAIETR